MFALVPLEASGGAFPGANGLVAFVRQAATQDVYVVPAGGGSTTLLVSNAAEPAWAADGDRIAYVANPVVTKQITVAAVSGTTASGATPIGPPGSTSPSWSPDGTKIAFVSGTDVWSMNSSDGGAQTNLTNSAGATDRDPAWSPDGTRIAFSSNRDGNFELYLMNADGSAQTRLTSSAGSDTEPNWSPGGGTIAFTSNRDGATQIYSIPSSGGAETRVTNTLTAESSPAWSPDGGLIAFASARVPPGIYTMTPGGGSQTALTNGADSQPDWQPGPPVNVSAPTVSSPSNLAPGSSVSASPGSWIGATSYSYEWLRCDQGNVCTVASGPSSSSGYTVQNADVGSSLRVRVTASNAAGSTGPVTSSNSTPVVSGPGPQNTSVPRVNLPSGQTAPKVGNLLTSSIGTWTGTAPITYTYQWKRCDPQTTSCYNLPGRTSSTFSVTADLYGWQLRVEVTATNSAGSSSMNSPPTAPVTADPPILRDTPEIDGLNVVGEQLFVGTGTWDGTQPITYTYQWRRCDPVGDPPTCIPIPGATEDTYTQTTDDVGHALRVYITGSNPAGSDLAITNHTFPTVPASGSGGPNAPTAPTATDSPTISGSARTGETLRAVRGSWSGESPLRYAYQWRRCNAIGESCKTIRNATRTAYTAQLGDIGYTLRFVVTVTNGIGRTTAASDPTDAVARSPRTRPGRRMVGTSRPDYLAGGAFNDIILGRAGNDTLRGGGGDDRIMGESGNDVVDGGNGVDRLLGGPGSDTILAADGSRDVVDCGPGPDRVVADADDRTIGCESISIADSQPAFFG